MTKTYGKSNYIGSFNKYFNMNKLLDSEKVLLFTLKKVYKYYYFGLLLIYKTTTIFALFNN